MNMIPCKCPCGTLIPEFDSRGKKRQFVRGHHSRCRSKETCQKLSDSHKGLKHSDATRQKMSILRKGQSKSDITRQRISVGQTGRTHSPKSKQLMSIVKLDKYCGENNPFFGKTHSKETIEKMSGENHYNWQGGISKEPYCQEWTPWLKEEIKERDKHQCKNPVCGSIESLGIHHIDYDKKNCSTNNLITLCRSCNAKANFNREHWINFYSNIIKGE